MSSTIDAVRRIVILGRGGAGKTSTAHRLGRVLDVPVLELDQYFWSEDLTATAPETWAQVQAELASADRWIMDGDLGPYDVLAPRLNRADTVLILDFGLARCAYRALRRSRERADFWWWVLTWRRRSRPLLLSALQRYAPAVNLHVITLPRRLSAFIRRARF